MSDTGKRTFETVRARYQDWFGEGRRPLPGRDVYDGSLYWETQPSGGDMSKTVLMGIGLVMGLLLLALAVFSFVTASSWAGYARDGAATGYTLAGIFLTIAGLGCIGATWNHNFRVVNRPAHH